MGVGRARARAPGGWGCWTRDVNLPFKLSKPLFQSRAFRDLGTFRFCYTPGTQEVAMYLNKKGGSERDRDIPQPHS